MKSVIILLVTFIMYKSFEVKSQNLLWVKDSQNGAYKEIMSIMVDQKGNSYVGGFYQDSLVMGNVKLKGLGFFNGFLIKIDPMGNAIWGINATSNGGSQYVTSVNITDEGMVVFGGTFSSSTLVLGTQTLSNSLGSSSYFLCSAHSNGSINWVKSGTGGVIESYSKLRYGSLYVIGSFNYSANLTIENYTLVSNGGNDGYVIKYDTSGTLLWVKSFGGVNDESLMDVANNSTGDLVVVGVSNSSIMTCEGSTISVATSTNNPVPYLLRYTSSGSFSSSNSLYNASTLSRMHLTCDQIGNTYLAGQFATGISVIGNYSAALTVPSGFMAKFNTNLTPIWTNTLFCSKNSKFTDIEFDGSGTLFSCGMYAGDSLAIQGNTLTNDSTLNNVFFSIFNNDGSLVSSKKLGGKYDDFQPHICMNSTSFVVGYSFKGKYSDFDGTTIYNASQNSNSVKLIFGMFNSPFVSVPILHKDLDYKIFPNPCSDVLNVEGILVNSTINIISVNGILLSQHNNYESTNLQIKMNSFPPGTYLIQISNKSSSGAKKIVKCD